MVVDTSQAAKFEELARLAATDPDAIDKARGIFTQNAIGTHVLVMRAYEYIDVYFKDGSRCTLMIDDWKIIRGW